jgi:16S rRNA (guanine527-N7)-methyltransferase
VSTSREATLLAVLARQRDRGLLGAGPLDRVRAHSRGFAGAAGEVPGRALDLGTGAGIPGLVLATECWPTTDIVLVDSSQRRCTYLEMAVAELALGDRVRVAWGRAEALGRDPGLRATMDVVVARSFAPPAVTAECAAPFLVPGGLLVVSDPPEGGTGPERWEPPGLARLGLAPEAPVTVDGASFRRLRQVAPCPEDFPRRPGVPRRHQLF